MGKERQERHRLPPITATTRELYLYSGNQCAFPGCVKSLLRNDSTWNCEVAHIHGVKLEAARGDHDLSDESLRAASNLLLMCTEHHKVIDNKKLEGTYTVEAVQEIKESHEKRYRQAVAGLERIVDTSEGSCTRFPTNFGAIDGFDADETEHMIEDIKPWIDAVAKLPVGVRDLVVLILAHGEPANRRGGDAVRVKVTQIEGVAQIDGPEILRRARHLEDDGLLKIDQDEGIEFFELVDPTSRINGWDMFTALHRLAAGDRAVLRRAINDRDFTVLEG